MYDQHLEFARKLALEAGAIMRTYFNNDVETSLKEDRTIVTVADKEINSLVIRRVQEAYPDHRVDGEEESFHQETNNVWVCDPIDGTNPFAMDLSISVFSLAFVVDGLPVLGVIYEPYNEMLYSAVKGEGAFLNGKKISVNSKSLDDTARINFDWWPNAEYDVLQPLQKLSKDHGVYLLSPGSTTHMGALVARGEFVASVFAGTKGKNVDIAAVKVIVEEAGGKATDLFGNDQRYDQDLKGSIVSNGVVHDQIVDYLKELAV